MNTTQAQTLKYGDKVFYGDFPAIVQRVLKNGVIVAWQSPRKGYINERVAAVYLKHRA